MYKPAVAIIAGLLAFWINFHPLHFIIPPHKASLVFGLVFPMLVSVCWGWRYGLLSITLGLGAQTMWFLWLPVNGWAPFVSIILYNLWILWHGWCAERYETSPLSNIYLAELPFRLFCALLHYTVFRWVFQFNPSPWAPHMTLKTAPMDFVHFVNFKLVFEGMLIILTVDILLNFQFIRKIFLIPGRHRAKTGPIMSIAMLIGLIFWGITGFADYIFYGQKLLFLSGHPNPNLAETMILNVPAYELLTRSFFILICLVSGVIIAKYVQRYKQSVSELRESEQRYRQIFNAPSDAIFIHDAASGKILDVNKGAERLYGYSHEELLRISMTDLSKGEPPYTEEMATRYIQAAILKGPQNFEWHARRKNGESFWVEVSLTKTTIGEGEYVIATVRDIDARKTAEQEQERLEADLRQVQKMEAIGTLAGGIAHDFNNILTSVIGYAELTRMLLVKNELSPNYIDQVLKSGERARDLVKQILTFSRKNDQQLMPIQPHHIIKESLQLIRATIPSTITLTQYIDAGTGKILADPVKIQQIFVNLCTNAIQAMGFDKGELNVRLNEHSFDQKTVSSGQEIEPGLYIELTISDTGSGMDEETRQRIFEPFFTTKEKGMGTGMGLAVVLGIVKEVKGAILVESAPGKGSTFRVYIPVIEVENEEENEHEYADIPTGTERILVVDDEVEIVDYQKAVLGSLGYAVTGQSNSREALELVLADPQAFDLLITDQTMPHMPGTELIERCLARRADLPIILCTGYSSMVDEDKARKIGVKGYIQKPFDRRKVAQAIRTILDGGEAFSAESEPSPS